MPRRPGPLTITSTPSCKRCGGYVGADPETGVLPDFCPTCAAIPANVAPQAAWNQSRQVEPTITKTGGGPSIPNV